jgi:hypothetical protein
MLAANVGSVKSMRRNSCTCGAPTQTALSQLRIMGSTPSASPMGTAIRFRATTLNSCSTGIPIRIRCEGGRMRCQRRGCARRKLGERRCGKNFILQALLPKRPSDISKLTEQGDAKSLFSSIAHFRILTIRLLHRGAILTCTTPIEFPCQLRFARLTNKNRRSSRNSANWPRWVAAIRQDPFLLRRPMSLRSGR